MSDRSGLSKVLVALGPDLEHRGMIITPHLPDLGAAQRGDRHRAGIAGIVFVDVPGCQQPHPGGQPGRHVEHPLTRGQQLPGQHSANAVQSAVPASWNPSAPAACSTATLPVSSAMPATRNRGSHHQQARDGRSYQGRRFR
jgi:hypothetical protein